MKNTVDVSEKQIFSQEVERSYAEALINLLQPNGEVLEIGFSKGYSASHIQTFHPKNHIIIESDPLVVNQAIKWSKKHSNVLIMQGEWEKILPRLGMFNTIVINDCLFGSKSAQIVSNKETVYARTLLQKEKELYHLIEEKIPELSKMRYSDQDIEEFFQNITPSQIKEASYFISKLKQSGQITEKQYEQIIKKHQLTKEVTQSISCNTKALNPVFVFLTECLKSHMPKSARFACFLNNGISNFEDPQFFEHIITNPNLDYQEKLISLSHMQNQESLAMLIERLD